MNTQPTYKPEELRVMTSRELAELSHSMSIAMKMINNELESR